MKSIEEYKTGETIIKQADASKGFYILEKGAVEVYKDKVMLNVLIYPGTIFGEIGDILGKPRTCSVKARTQTTLVRYDCPDLKSLVDEHPDVAVKIMQTLANRLETTTQKLADLSNMTAFLD